MGKRRSSFIASDDSGDERPVKAPKKSAKGSKSADGADVDSEGNRFWDLSNKRRVVVQKFKGNIFVNLREYYEDKSGEMKPGKKGIMLSTEQYQSLVGLMPAINTELRKNGVAIDGDAVEGIDNSGDEDEVQKVAKKSQKGKPEPKKANIEATSDEDDE